MSFITFRRIQQQLKRNVGHLPDGLHLLVLRTDSGAPHTLRFVIAH